MINQELIDKCFTKILMHKSQLVQYTTKNRDHIEVVEFSTKEGNVIPILISHDNDKSYCLDVLVSSAHDRNIIVSDTHNISGEITNRLLGLIQNANYRLYDKYDKKYNMKYWLIDKSCKHCYTDLNLQNTEIILIDGLYEMIEKYNILMPRGKENIILGITEREDNNIIIECPTVGLGIACLENTEVLLGAF